MKYLMLVVFCLATVFRTAGAGSQVKVPVEMVIYGDWHLPCFSTSCEVTYTYNDFSNPTFPTGRHETCACDTFNDPPQLKCCCSCEQAERCTSVAPCRKYCYDILRNGGEEESIQ